MNVRYVFSGALLHARTEKKLTQAEAAELLGISTRWMQKIEKGAVAPNFELTCKIVSKFDVNLYEIVKSEECNIKYELRKDRFKNEDGILYTSYGINVYENNTLIKAIKDITTDEEALMALVYKCNSLKASKLHINDIIEDFLLR